MGADTIYYVEVYRLVKEVVEVSALTSYEAREKALKLDGAMMVGCAVCDKEELTRPRN